MREFARKKFSSHDSLMGSSKSISDPTRDVKWLTKLSEVKNFFQKDPVSLGIIYRSFPNLANLFLTALAATADYSHSESDALNDPTQILNEMFRSFGTKEDGTSAYEPAWAMQNFMTGINIQKAIENIGLPSDKPPATPDIFHLRIGAANFYVPPVSISVNTSFKTGSLSGGAIRQKASPKFNTGFRETTINVKLYFPNYEEIWGISIDDASKIVLDSEYKIDFSNTGDEQKIDKFLSSLRGLIAAFKYAPILPIKNHYLNSVHGITGVALASMNISTVPNFPFALVVDLELLNFNHKPFLPMIKDFNQAVKWGHFRHYMGKAAGAMYKYVNEEFVLEADSEAAKKKATTASGNTVLDTSGGFVTTKQADDVISDIQKEMNEEKYITTNIMSEWQDGKNLTLYVPAKIQSKIFTPDESTFRTAEEAANSDVGRGMWESILNNIGLDINESASYHRTLGQVIETSKSSAIMPSMKSRMKTIVDIATAGTAASNIKNKVYDSLVIDYISRNNITDKDQIKYLKNRKPSWEIVDGVPATATPEEAGRLIRAKDAIYNGTNSTKGALQYFIDNETDILAKKNHIDFDPTSSDKHSNPEWTKIKDGIEKNLVDQFNVSLYERFFSNSDIINLLDTARQRAGSFSFREWDVPMLQVDLDPKSVIVNAVNVTMANNLAKMQLQLQDEPTYQHIGSKDSYINISMTVFGEKELQKIKRTFDFLSGLARLEHAAGVIGFLGIKNIITALSGIKYVLPLSYNVDTIPSYPHVYSVQLSFVDFDVYQQKRESISSDQQRKFIEDFKNKKNPFLRLKQNWSVFNAYPDLPLQVKNSSGDVVGCLDPDFYFRSFESFDNDVVNNIVDPGSYTIPIQNTVESTKLNASQLALAERVKEKLLQNKGSLQDIKKFLVDDNHLKPTEAILVFRSALFNETNDTELEKNNLNINKNLFNKYPTLWKDFIGSFVDELGEDHTFEDLKFDTRYGQVRIGDLISGSKEQMETFTAIVNTSEFSLKDNKLPYFDPDTADFFGLIHYIPSAISAQLNKIPALYQTPDGGFIFGYVNEEDGNFYIAADSLNLTKNSSGEIQVNGINNTTISDTSVPNRDNQNVHTGVPGATSVDQYQNPMSSGGTNQIESISTNGTYKDAAKHWQKMMLDTQYRDLSGRMIRAYPTYMLWLIDEGGYFAGVKLFDNFYGLQSVIDFSIVQSEDILGDTLILRLSNAYSKLTKPELTLTEIVNTPSIYGEAGSNLSEGTATIVDVLLNASRNFQNHFQNKYVTEVEHIRLKPGVRVHLRGGYGANPNSLQILFNGVIASVEQGEIVTVTAQSDAIELSPIINSSNKKGDSGHIDGGINTGLWLSEPRDLMIRLLSMGSSRVKEAFALATRGTVFSENKFGIRHFGSILYEPLTEREKIQHQNYREAVMNGINAVAKNPITGTWNQVTGAGMNALTGGTVAAGLDRAPVWGAMSALWSNFSTQRDLEIFKRNIYPGNGIGIGQFMGGDIGEGWSSLASVDQDKLTENQFSYLERLTDSSWSRLIETANKSGELDASDAVTSLTSSYKRFDSSHSIGATKGIAFATAAVTAGVAAFVPGAGAAVYPALGLGLTGALAGRGTSNLFATMGLVSDLDDDVYDEVSFRAQTYMRSVWDMFQMCARLLPNYIVAVRPFEDRSTVFYGKPHWLYTSGVVPISTGFIDNIQAQQDGVVVPQYSLPDGELSKIMDTINKETDSVADAGAFKSLQESTVAGSIAKAANDSLAFKDIYAAGGALNGKVINFNDSTRNKYYENGQVKSILPVNEGKVQVGFHLPFGDITEINQEVSGQHKQVPGLPLRFSYPFFTNRASGTLPSLDFDKILKGTSKYEDFQQKISNIVQVADMEKQMIDVKDGKTKLVSKGANGEYVLNENFNFANSLAVISDNPNLSGTAAFDPSGVNIEGLSGAVASALVTMPLPIIDPSFQDIEVVNNKYEFKGGFKDVYASPDNAYNRQLEYPELKLNFSEWGKPATADEELSLIHI